MCFESDSLFLPKQTIKVKIPGIIDNPETDALRYHNATVKWSKHRHYSTFQNCYGVEFTEPLHNIEKFVLHTEKIKQTSLLLNISAISGMLVFLVYFFIKLFFGLKSVSVPFELIIFGFGLIGFKRFIRCNAKALKTRPEKRILKKMYYNHYNLKKKPFDITPDPAFFWLGEKHKEGWASLEYGILENKGFLLLTGDIGTGKTALINL